MYEILLFTLFLLIICQALFMSYEQCTGPGLQKKKKKKKLKMLKENKRWT